jgi:hypothetical protein
VTITKKTYVIKSNHLDYYTNSGHPISSDRLPLPANLIIFIPRKVLRYQKEFSPFSETYIKYDDRLIAGDSLYYDRNKEFASATRNVKITDSINRGIVKGHYAEIYKQKTPMFVTKELWL